MITKIWRKARKEGKKEQTKAEIKRGKEGGGERREAAPTAEQRQQDGSNLAGKLGSSYHCNKIITKYLWCSNVIISTGETTSTRGAGEEREQGQDKQIFAGHYIALVIRKMLGETALIRENLVKPLFHHQ